MKDRMVAYVTYNKGKQVIRPIARDGVDEKHNNYINACVCVCVRVCVGLYIIIYIIIYGININPQY